MHRLISALVLASCIGLLVPIASAQRGPADRARARALYDEALTHYRAGRFDESATLLQEARGLYPEPILTYNLARVLEALGDVDGAIGMYREYLAEAPSAPDARAVRELVSSLERTRDALRAASAREGGSSASALG
nr:tetratricopeptide repeat protein [Myxococcota bacterium]